MHTTTNITATATFNSSTTAIIVVPTPTSIATTCMVKSIKMKIIAMANFIK